MEDNVFDEALSFQQHFKRQIEEDKGVEGETERAPARDVSPPLYISISGIIGAGKSTLAKALSKTMNLPLYQENAQNNPYLGPFYASGTEKYGYNLQISLLTERFNQQQQIIWNGKGAVQDRTIYEDSIFCRMLWKDGKISDLDYETYQKLSSIMFNLCGRPGIIVHLDVSPEEAYKRLKMRARDSEKGVPLEYLQKLHKAYEDWLENMKEVRIIRIHNSNMEYSTKEEFDLKLKEFSEKMAAAIKIELEKSTVSVINIM